MAEKNLQSAPREYVSVIVNFKNLRFMTLIKEDCLISDLIQEAEKTFAKLCSVKFKIKTLKNSVNAVLPHWYPVAPLIRNQDEIFAFTENAEEVLNIGLTKHCSNRTIQCTSTSPMSSGIMPDSGFASPTLKLGSTVESEEPTRMDVRGRKRQGCKNTSDENVSQEELLSEVFSLKDHNLNRPKQNNIQGMLHIGQGNKHNDSPKINNAEIEKESSLKINRDKVKLKETPRKTQVKNLQETMHLTKNETPVTDKSQNKQGLAISQDTQKKEVKNSKDKTVASKRNSSTDSSDKSSWESSKEKEMKKTSQPDVGRVESELSDDSSESSEENVHKTKEAKSKPETKDKMTGNNVKNHKEKEDIKCETKGDTKKVNTKLIRGQSSESSSSGDDTDEEKTSTKNKSLKTSKVTDITMDNTAMESENIKGSSSGKKDETNEQGSISCSVSLSSWSLTDDEDKEEKTTEIKATKHKDQSQTANNDGSKNRTNKNQTITTPAPDNAKKIKGKKKNVVKKDDNDEQTNIDVVPSPAKSVGHKKRKDSVLATPAKSVGTKNSFASPAKSVCRHKRSGLSKSKASLDKTDKVQDAGADSEGSVSTLKAPFTQLSAKEKMKSDSDSEDSSQEDHALKKGKDGKEKGKNNTDTKTGHVSSANQVQQNDPDTSLGLSETGKKSSTRKSAAMLSTSKVASWLLSNPMSANAADETSDDTAHKTKTRSKNTTKDNTSEVEVTVNETELKPETDLSKETKKNNNSIDVAFVDDTTVLSVKGNGWASQKRKVDEESEQEQSTKAKKRKKKKTEGNKKEMDQETEVNQDKPSVKTPVTTKKEKKTSLLLPKISKGLSALVEDESDYSPMFTNKLKKRKLTPPTINRLKQTGFLTPSNDTGRKASETKTPKSRMKKTPASQPSKTIKMNKKEQEFLDNSVMNLETLLNDETIRW